MVSAVSLSFPKSFGVALSPGVLSSSIASGPPSTSLAPAISASFTKLVPWKFASINERTLIVREPPAGIKAIEKSPGAFCVAPIVPPPRRVRSLKPVGALSTISTS